MVGKPNDTLVEKQTIEWLQINGTMVEKPDDTMVENQTI